MFTSEVSFGSRCSGILFFFSRFLSLSCERAPLLDAFSIELIDNRKNVLECLMILENRLSHEQDNRMNGRGQVVVLPMNFASVSQMVPVATTSPCCCRRSRHFVLYLNLMSSPGRIVHVRLADSPLVEYLMFRNLMGSCCSSLQSSVHQRCNCRSGRYCRRAANISNPDETTRLWKNVALDRTMIFIVVARSESFRPSSAVKSQSSDDTVDRRRFH